MSDWRRRKLPSPRPRDRAFGEAPAAGRDLPYTLEGGSPLHAPYVRIPTGTPLPLILFRERDYGEGYGVCVDVECPHCGKWLTYPQPRTAGDRVELATIYEDCADHALLESGPSWDPWTL